MSDQSPPPKQKPGSLRDRIAAFENKGASPSQTVPPPPRPKPGGLAWKPRPPSPTTSPDNIQSADRKPQSTSGMSASDAMESIGRGGSLKERMAALQGKGAFGGPPPPIAPKPNAERPKWKPPPAVTTTSSEAEPNEGIDTTGRATSRSPPPRAAVSPDPEKASFHREADVAAQEGDSGDPDSEEEERQRRAAIAARMARLGGTRLGMGPPIFAPKPVGRKPEPAPEVKGEAQLDQLSVVRESSQALVTSPPHDLPAAAVTETERKDDLESTPPVPTRLPTSMPMPAGPRRVAPPRKKSSKNAPTTALPEPPVEEARSVAAQSPPISNEPRVGAEHDASVIASDAQKDLEVAEAPETTHDDRLGTTVDAGQRPPSLAATIPFHPEPVEEPEKQEAEEEHVGGAGSHVEEESMHTAADDQPPEVESGEEEEEEEAHRQRVAAKLAQLGAFNPLAGPPPAPPRQPSLDESVSAPLDVEDEVNVDTEELKETVPPPPAVLPRRDTVQSFKHDTAEPHLDNDQDDVKDHRDGGRVSLLEGQPIARSPLHDIFQQGTAPTHEADAFGVALVGPDIQARSQQDGDNVTIADIERDPAGSHEIPAPRFTRPTPPPPPVNLGSKPTPPCSPPLSPPPKTSLQALRVDEEECPPSPDIPPRPVPPPGRSGSMTENMSSPPRRRSIPPPSRRTTLASPPSSPPPVPTSSRPVNRRPDAPQIITTLDVQEQGAPEEHQKEHAAEEEPSETVTPRPDVPEDEESTRRRAIAERMARLGGIRLGGPPPMNPLSRPPLPAAPPPTSIPPDELDEEGPREEEEEDEAVRKQRIAAKLVGMGGMRLGMLPPPASARRLLTKQEDSESEDVMLPVPVPAPPQRPPPTRKLPPSIASVEQEPSEQGGPGSHGTSDDGVQVEAEESEMEEVRYSDAEVPVGSEEEGTPARRSTHTAGEVLLTPPLHMTPRSPGRPPIPTIPATLWRRPSATAGSVSSSRQASLDEPSLDETPTMSGSVLPPQSDYVMVEADPDDSDLSAAASPPPRRKSARGSGQRTIPALPPVPPPSAIDPPEALSSSAQWELASIPQGAEFGEGSEMASSGWSEDSTAVHVPAPVLSWSQPGSRSASAKVVSSMSVSGSGTGSVSMSGSGSGSGRRSFDQPQLTTDELITIWGKTGVRVVDAASTLYEKSKRTLVGDGSYAGFVRAVLAQVPGAVYPGGLTPTLPSTASSSSTDDTSNEWGYAVYAQTGHAVQRRVSDIMPGDVIALWDAKFKGHKGLHAYTQTVGTTAGAGEKGTGAPFVGIVSEFDGKKSKVRVWQANQHVGQQTVENVSYRLDDLKSGQVKVYRVLEA